MRAEFMLALRRESVELERELIEQRIEEAYAHVEEYLVPAFTYLQQTADLEGRHALEVIDRAITRALEVAARSGIGGRATRHDITSMPSRCAIPTAAMSPYAPPAPAAESGDDTVLWMRPIGS
ncbi:MAG TPA: hypothetical protein VFW96_20090 [Thermomicrobiales bacterium]|nr:hypothetical protein [Thermomicrobiales bacterium]